MQRANRLKNQLLTILKGAASTGALATAVAVAPTPAHADAEEAVAVLLGVAALYAAYEAGDNHREHRVDHHVHYDSPKPPHHYREKHYHKKHPNWHREKHKHCKHYRKKRHRDHAYYHDRREHYWRYRDWDD